MIRHLRTRDPLVEHAKRLLFRVAPDSFALRHDPVALADGRTSACDARELLALRLDEATAAWDAS